MVAPKRKNRFQWKTNFIKSKKKTIKIPLILIKQVVEKFVRKHKKSLDQK